jgi:MFS family permease
VGQLFASNAILPMLSFVYWPTVVGPAREEVINIATLAGSIFGMILFGLLGDIYGRRKMYGIELTLLIVGTVGVVLSSNGFATGDGLQGSMDIESWLVFFRFVSGVGLGGVSLPSRVMYLLWCGSPNCHAVRKFQEGFGSLQGLKYKLSLFIVYSDLQSWVRLTDDDGQVGLSLERRYCLGVSLFVHQDDSS